VLNSNTLLLGQAHVLATPRACSAHEICAFLVLAAGTACPSADVSTACALPTAQELGTVAVLAHDRSRIPACTLCGLGHCVIQTLRVAAFAARRLAGVATAFAALPTHEVVIRTMATCTTWTHADVPATGAAFTALELTTFRVDAGHGIRCASGARCNRVLVAWLPLVAALAARGSTSIATALAPSLARKCITQVVPAAEIALGFAALTTALSVAAGKLEALVVAAHRYTPAVEELRHVFGTLGWPQGQEGALLVYALAVRAVRRPLRRSPDRHHKGSCCCKLLQRHVAKKARCRFRELREDSLNQK